MYYIISYHIISYYIVLYYIIHFLITFFHYPASRMCDTNPHREGVAKALWGLQKRGLLEYSLSLPAVYVTVNVQTCYDSLLEWNRSEERGGERREGQGQDNRVDSAVICSIDATTNTSSMCTTTAATTAMNGARGSSRKSDSDGSTLLNDWVWNLSVRVCDVLTRIESGVSRRSEDMWRVGNIIASTCAVAKDLGSDSRSKRRDGELCVEEKETVISSLESDAQEGASSFLCHYLETLSGRDASYGVEKGRKVGQKSLKQSQSEGATVGEDIDEDGDGDVADDLKSHVLWEQKFFSVPLPVAAFPTLSSQHAAAGGQYPGVPEGAGGRYEEEKNRSLGFAKDGGIVEGGRDDEEVSRTGRSEVEQMNVPCELQGSTSGVVCTSSRLEEKETSSEIRALKRDVLSLSRDPRLLHVRDQIANPVLRAFSSHGQHGQHGHGQGGRQAGPTWAPKPSKGPQAKASSLKGKVTWKNRPLIEDKKNSDCEVDLEPVIPEINSPLCAMRSECIPDKGSVELLAVLIARILHGLPSKLLTAAAWKDQTVCWGQYRNFSFESLLKACRRVISQ